jgi:hypothetical protein
MNNWLFVDFSRIFLLVILIFKGLTARRLYKSFGVIGLIQLKNKTLRVAEEEDIKMCDLEDHDLKNKAPFVKC